jgi:hypothetical protein
MGTNCAPLLADLFLYSYEAEFVEKLLTGSQRKKFSMTSPNFCIYDNLPFEEDLAFYFNNLEFPLPKDDVYQV